MSLGEYLGSGAGITKGLYRLENANDSSGNASNLNPTGSPTYVSGLFHNGVLLPSASYLSNTNRPFDINAGPFFMGIWFKLGAEIASGQGTFMGVSCVNPSGYIWTLYDYNAGTRRIQCGRYIQPAPGVIITLNYVVTLGTAKSYHIAYSYDGATMTLYLNGFAVGQQADSGRAGAGTGSYPDGRQVGTATGGYQPLGTVCANSIEDEAIFENVSWSQQKLQKYYTWAKGRFTPSIMV